MSLRRPRVVVASTALHCRIVEGSGPIGPSDVHGAFTWGPEEARALLTLSRLFDYVNSKRLRKALDVELQGLYESGFLQVNSECDQKLKQVRPATILFLSAGRSITSRSYASRPSQGHRPPDAARVRCRVPSTRLAGAGSCDPGRPPASALVPARPARSTVGRRRA